jgi:hypothetical protein
MAGNLSVSENVSGSLFVHEHAIKTMKNRYIECIEIFELKDVRRLVMVSLE